MILGGLAAHLRITTGAQSARELSANVEFQVSFAEQQGLGVSIGRNELDILETRRDHAVHRIHPAATHANNLDNGVIVALVETHELPLG
jgi:hypothetical protein